jgi:hypothetical protein
MLMTGRTDMCREQHSTIANAFTVCRRPDFGCARPRTRSSSAALRLNMRASRTVRCHDQMRTGQLAYLKVGRRRIITRQHLEAFLTRAS